MRYYVTFASGREVEVDVTHLPNGQSRVTVEGKTVDADTISLADSTNVSIGGRIIDLWLEGPPPDVGVVVGAHRFYATVESERMRAANAALARKVSGDGLVKSPMPGRVLKVLVEVGQEIVHGTPLVVVEAMKMENELSAARDGTVKKVFVTAGVTVEGGAPLVEIG